MKKTAIITFVVAVVLITITLLGNANNHKKVVDSTAQSSKSKISATKNQSTTSKSQSSSLISSSSSAAIDQSVNDDKSSSSTSSSVVNDPNTASYNPNKTAQGTEVTAEMITKVRQELIHAGLPADKWAPSDIKKIITESSQQNMSVIDYAKANYHQ